MSVSHTVMTWEYAATLLRAISCSTQNKESAFNSPDIILPHFNGNLKMKAGCNSNSRYKMLYLSFLLKIIKVILKVLRLIWSFVFISILVIKVCQL